MKKSCKYVLYGKSEGMTKKFGTFKNKKEAKTASGIERIELENSGYEEPIKFSIKRKC